MLIALMVLNALYLICSLLFNAELLNMAGANIPLKKLEILETYSQVLAATSMCLLVWRICYCRYQGKGRALWISLAVSTALVTPVTWWFQGSAPDWIAEKFPGSLRVSSLYAYVTKKGLLYDSLTIPQIPYMEFKDRGEGKAFIANLGVLMSVQGSYVERIDKNFQGFAAAVFRDYAARNGDTLYECLQETIVPTVDDITRTYAQLEGFRAAGIPGNEWRPIQWLSVGVDLGYHPSIDEYARSINPEVRTRAAIANTTEVRHMAKSALGPLYVKGMNLLATREQYQSYLPGIADNMAFDVAHTDIHGAEGLNVLKNMWFIPFSLLSGLFFGAISLVVLIISGIEALRRLPGRIRFVRPVAIVSIVIFPLVVGNGIVDSSGYKRSGDGEGKLEFVVVHWNDGSEVGRIVREAQFASIPDLDDVQEQLKRALNGFIMGAYSTFMGQAVIADAAGNFARKSKVASYSLAYKGFDQLKDGFDEYKTATKQQSFAGYCAEAGLSTFQNDFGVKGKDHSDSECAIAQKLASDGKFEENYTFNVDKSLFAGLFVSKSYTLETN